MSWRTVVISQNSKLDFRMGYMVVRRSEETIKVHISEIAVLIIESTAVSLTSALMCELTKQKVKIIFCDEKRNPQSELIPYYGSHDTSVRIRSQIAWDEITCKNVWAELVCLKIAKQAEVLELYDLDESELLRTYISQVEPGDMTNREGHAAKVYFNALFGKQFTRTSDDIRNSALNYGYSILLSAFNREIVSDGYITQIGIFHDNMFNCFNLACDLMEPFRPLVDRVVFETNYVKFEWEEKAELINIMNKEIMIDNKNQHCINAISIYTKSVLSAIEEKDVSLIKCYEL